MDRGLTLFFGTLLTFASAWFGLVFAPFMQLNAIPAHKPDENSASYPQPLQGLAAAGKKVYAVNGCIYCHSQQIRPADFGVDIKRGWGSRRSVARDFIHEKPIMLGTMRTGPDLANIGVRRNITQAVWHHLHLYNPQITSPGSIMPPFKYLYTMRKIEGQSVLNVERRSTEGGTPAGGVNSIGVLPLDQMPQIPTDDWPEPDRSNWRKYKAEVKAYDDWLKTGGSKSNTPEPTKPTLPKPTYEIVPTEEAIALVTYLVSLDRSAPVPEAD